jgi:outer membrane protein assembly factor BamB
MTGRRAGAHPEGRTGWPAKASTRLRAVALTLLLAACASDKPKPTPLEPIEPKLAVRVAWQARIDPVPFPLGVAVRDGAFVVAAGEGTVVALAAADGRELWRGSAGTRLSAGVGSDGRFAAVVTRGNELVVLERGTERWRKRLTSLVTTPPLVAGERVFVMGVDRAVLAYDVLDGRALFVFQRPGEALTLAQPGVLAAWRDTLLVGQGPLLTALDPLRGSVRWEVPLASPRGTNEVERLADLVGPLLRAGDTLCARAFQSAVGCANPANGTLRWSRTVGGVQPVGGDAELLFGADASDRITAWKIANGDIAWTNEKYLYRTLSGPLSIGAAVVFGDAEGQVHFLARDSGQALQRVATDGSAVMGTPVASGDTVLVVTRNGGLFALRRE